MDADMGQPLLPASWLALTVEDALGNTEGAGCCHGRMGRQCAGGEERGGGGTSQDGQRQARRSLAHAASRKAIRGPIMELLRFLCTFGGFNRSVPPGALPAVYALCKSTTPSISHCSRAAYRTRSRYCSLEFAVGHLPVSLTHLVFDTLFDQPLLPGYAALRHCDWEAGAACSDRDSWASATVARRVRW